MMNLAMKFLFLIVLLVLGGCAAPYNYNSPYVNTVGGAVLGGATGAVVGHQLDDDDGKYIGGAIGTLIGGMIGHQLDSQYQAGYTGGQYGNPGYYQQPSYNQNYPDTGYEEFPNSTYQSGPQNGPYTEFVPYPPNYNSSGNPYYPPNNYTGGNNQYISGY